MDENEANENLGVEKLLCDSSRDLDDNLSILGSLDSSPVQKIGRLIVIYAADISARKSPANFRTHRIVTLESVINILMPSL